jgi:hypothetical protein
MPKKECVITWKAGKLYGGSPGSSPVLFAQHSGSPNVWVEVMEGSGVRFIITKMRDAGEKGEKVVKTLTTNIAQIDPEHDRKAREMGLPGAGYAMELAMKMLCKARR